MRELSVLETYNWHKNHSLGVLAGNAGYSVHRVESPERLPGRIPLAPRSAAFCLDADTANLC